MKKKLFISYSDHDKDKVTILENELESHFLFEPLVIAERRDPLQFLPFGGNLLKEI